MKLVTFLCAPVVDFGRLYLLFHSHGINHALFASVCQLNSTLKLTEQLPLLPPLFALTMKFYSQ